MFLKVKQPLAERTKELKALEESHQSVLTE